MEVKLEPDWCKNALNKKYKVCYETEKGIVADYKGDKNDCN